MLSPRGKPEHKVSRRVGYNICRRNDRGRANDGNFVTKKRFMPKSIPRVRLPCDPADRAASARCPIVSTSLDARCVPSRLRFTRRRHLIFRLHPRSDLGASEPRGGHAWLWHLGRRTHWQIGSDRMASQSSAIPEPVGPIAERHRRIFASGFGGFKTLTREGRVARKPLLEGIPMNNHAPA